LKSEKAAMRKAAAALLATGLVALSQPCRHGLLFLVISRTMGQNVWLICPVLINSK